MIKNSWIFPANWTLVNGNKIVLKKLLTIKNSIIKTSDFENWKKFLESIKEFNKYFISVTKK